VLDDVVAHLHTPWHERAGIRMPEHAAAVRLRVACARKVVTAATRFPQQDFRAAIPRFAPDALPANMALFEVVKTWAQRKNASAAQLALAWLMTQKPWIIPIPGTTKVAHLQENLRAVEIAFAPQELKELNAAVAAVSIRGERLPPSVLAATGVEAPPKR
jgi:aryl-alcohol dehydrogenase-like predicted oxidoreductase